MDPVISVIVPVYKVEQYLDECVRSIVEQTYKNLEIILVDDGSPDNCPQICDDWAARDTRIKVIHKENGGASSARNAALKVAEGDFFGFVDSDDRIAPNMYEGLYRLLKEADAGIACCCFCRIDESGIVNAEQHFRRNGLLSAVETVEGLLYEEIDTSVWSKLFRRDVFADIRFPEGEVNEEWPILLPLILKADGMVCTQEVYYYYRGREGSITNTSYMQEANSGIVYMNLTRIKAQLDTFKLSCGKAYRHFASSSAASRALAMEKKYPMLSPKVREDYAIYRKILWENIMVYMLSKRISLKNKLLTGLVLTKLLRPLYSIFCKEKL